MEADGELTFSRRYFGHAQLHGPRAGAATRHSVGPATDVYALGAILYELLTGPAAVPPLGPRGHIAAGGVGRASVHPQGSTRTSRDVETICLKCLQKEPHQRYVSACALAEDLRRFERGEPIELRPAGRSTTPCGMRRRPALAAALASGLLLASAIVVIVLRSHVRSERLSRRRPSHTLRQT